MDGITNMDSIPLMDCLRVPPRCRVNRSSLSASFGEKKKERKKKTVHGYVSSRSVFGLRVCYSGVCVTRVCLVLSVCFTGGSSEQSSPQRLTPTHRGLSGEDVCEPTEPL